MKLPRLLAVGIYALLGPLAGCGGVPGTSPAPAPAPPPAEDRATPHRSKAPASKGPTAVFPGSAY